MTKEVLFESTAGFCESWEVRFWKRAPDGTASQASVLAYTRGKNKSKQVSAAVKKEYKVADADLISVRYQ